jgi:guanylate kinase
LKVKEKEEFAEYREMYGNLYGTPKSFLTEIVDKGKIPLLNFGLSGIKYFLEKYPDAITVFITLNKIEDVRKRLVKRGTESPKSLEKRIKNFEKC